jgi:hypothetical protein
MLSLLTLELNSVHDWLNDCLEFYVPLKNISLIWRRHHCRWRAAKCRPMLGAQGLWALRDLYRATPAVTRDLGFSGLIRRTAPISRLLRHAWGCGGPILTRILTGVSTWQSTNLKRRCLDLFCNYDHSQCVCNHSTAHFYCNHSFCHIFGISKHFSLTMPLINPQILRFTSWTKLDLLHAVSRIINTCIYNFHPWSICWVVSTYVL